MKKLLFALLLTCSSAALADVIPCPTPTNYSFNGTPWRISIETLETPATCDMDDRVNFSCAPVGFERFYNPVTKIADFQLPWGSYTALTFDSIQFSLSEPGFTARSDGLRTLKCRGHYSGRTSAPGWIRKKVLTDQSGSMEAELQIPDEYKQCTPSRNINGLFFDCSK